MSAPLGPYRPVVRAGDLLFAAGQIGVVDGRIVPGGVVDETRQALANLAAVLATEGAGLGDVVKVTVYLKHLRDMPLVNEVYAEAFGERLPARSAVAVVELPLLALVEIDAVAHRPA
jgi:2-iminobutanoate/2-iminopropanoate deaminase